MLTPHSCLAFLCAVALSDFNSYQLPLLPTTPFPNASAPLRLSQLVNRPRDLPFTSTHGTSSCLHTQVPPLTAPLRLSLPLLTPWSPWLFASSCSLCNQRQPDSDQLLHRNLPCVGFLGGPQQKYHELRCLKSQKPHFLRVLEARVQSQGISRALLSLQAGRSWMLLVLICFNTGLTALHLLHQATSSVLWCVPPLRRCLIRCSP